MAKTTRDGPAESQGEADSTNNEPTGGESASPRASSTTRRKLLQMGAGFAAISSVPRGFSAPAVAAEPISVPKAPNIIVLMTDQERHHVHWPGRGGLRKTCLRWSGSSATVSISSAPIRRHANARRRGGSWSRVAFRR